MLLENETLFVEHKGGLAFAAAKAICSFANTLGGWVLIGVTNGEPNEGKPDGWSPVAASEMTDRVRECLKTYKVDPIPAFAATVPSFCTPGRRVGVIRVYESDDAPHVTGDGQVFLRSVAEDVNKKRVYRAGGVETQAVLVDLVERGRRGVMKARERLLPSHATFAVKELGFGRGNYSLHPPLGGIMLRAAPVTRARLVDWAVSSAADEALATIACRMVGSTPAECQVKPVLHHAGLAAHTTGYVQLETTPVPRPHPSGYPDFDRTRRPDVCATADTAGIVGISMRWNNEDPPRDPIPMTLDEFRDHILLPVIDACCELLVLAELHGRSILQLAIGNLGQLVEVFEDDPHKRQQVPQLGLEGTISVPLSTDRCELDQLADRWRDDVGRQLGYRRFRH